MTASGHDASPAPRPRLLTVGAYERDNFGDLLFLVVTGKYLEDFDVTAASPFAADMTPLLDNPVVAFGDALRDQEFDAVWSVGGEIGGTTVESAYRMSTPPEVYARFTAASYADQRVLLRQAVGDAPITAGYIPTPGAFPLNAGAATVINSAGLAGVGKRPVHRRAEMLDVLRTTDGLSVRDQASSDYLSSVGVAHTLAPDVVHTLPLIDPFARDADADNVVVQASAGIIRRLGPRKLAQHLVACGNLDGLRIRFLLAGTATGHDTLDSVERVAAEIARLAPSREVEIITDRGPMEIVDHIRRARVVVSSSLHVRIVAASYGVPRLTFTRGKPTRYAQLWDPHMPVDVELATLDAAVGDALAAGARDEVLAASQRLTELADANIRALADTVRATLGTDRADVAARRVAAYEDVAAARRPCELRESKLRVELDEVTRELAATRAELAAERARAVPAEPMTKRARRAAGKVRRKVSRG